MRLKLFAQSVESLRGLTVEAGGRSLKILSVRDAKAPVARLDGISSREQAEALRGTTLTIARDALPPLADDEYYHADLIGRSCHGAGGEMLGTVMAVENYGAGDLLEIELANGARALVPFRRGIAELDGEAIRVDPGFLA